MSDYAKSLSVRLFLALLAVAVVATLTKPAAALEVIPAKWNGLGVLLLEGEINLGDAQKVAEGLSGIEAAPHGYKIVFLNSLGGNVAEALRISAVFDKDPVHTVIGNDMLCASACASILFIAGTYRSMMDEGLFGQHSCSHEGERHEYCNEVISTHAFEHGVSYGSVAAFVTKAEPSEMAWLTRESLDCMGISLYFGDEPDIEPCIWEIVNGRKYPPTFRWRVDLYRGAYRAFVRPVSDYEREFELGLYCEEDHPGRLTLTFDIKGSVDDVVSVITGGMLRAVPIFNVPLEMSFSQIEAGYTRLTIPLPIEHTMDLLTAVDSVSLELSVSEGYQPMSATVPISEQRERLIFVANHCVPPV